MSQSQVAGRRGPDREFATSEKTPSSSSRPQPSRALGETPQPRGIRIRHQARTAQVYVPAAVAALTTLWVGGLEFASVAQAAVFVIASLFVSRLLRDFPYPLRLLPASRNAIVLLPIVAGAAAFAGFELAQDDQISVGVLLSATGFAALAAIVVEIVVDQVTSANPLRIAVLGAPDFVPAIRREVEAVGDRREVEVVGWLNVGGRHAADGRAADQQALDRVRAAVTEHGIDLLVRGPGSGSSRSGRDAYDAIAAGCLDLPVRMIDGNQLYEHVFGHVPIGTIESAWFLFLMHPRFQASSTVSKRALDLIVGAFAAVIAAPLILLGAIAIKLGDGGRVFYRQTRVGERGREFRILKLRTMTSDAQAAGSPQWSGAGDARVTGVGRVLRRLHIDELPQIVNVLRGDMTLVGPRPEQPQITAELERVFPHYTRRLLVKPGVTGWAQVRCGYAGSELGTAWKLCHDLFYLKHRSLLIDLLIMLETLVIAARDSHRPLRAPQAEFLFKGDGRVRALEPDRERRDPRPEEIPLDSSFGAPTQAPVAH